MGYIIGLIPPILDSIVIYFNKFQLSKYNINSTVITIYIGILALITSLLISLFTGFYQTNIKIVIIIIASGIFGIFYVLAYFKALTYDEASRVGSYFQLVPVIVLLLSFLILGEKLLFKQYLGSFFIIIAGFFLSIQKTDSGIIKINKALWYMIISCFFSALVYVLFKLGVKELGFWKTLPYEGLGNGIAIILILAYGKNFGIFKKITKKMSKKFWINLLISELIARISRYTLFFALTFISASIASVLIGSQPFFLLIIGIFLSLWFPSIVKESITKKTLGTKLVSTVGIFMGLYLIFL